MARTRLKRPTLPGQDVAKKRLATKRPELEVLREPTNSELTRGAAKSIEERLEAREAAIEELRWGGNSPACSHQLFGQDCIGEAYMRQIVHVCIDCIQSFSPTQYPDVGRRMSPVQCVVCENPEWVAALVFYYCIEHAPEE